MTRSKAMVSLTLAALAGGASTSQAAIAPTVRTGAATGVTQQTALLNGSVNPHGVPTAYYFRYGRTRAYGTRTPTADAGAGSTKRHVEATLTGLTPHTRYHYQLVAFSTAGTTHGADRTFRTPQIPTTSSIAGSPNPVVFGKTVFIWGNLTGPDVTGERVALQSKPYPFTGPFQQIGNTVLTSTTGAYSFVWPPQVNMQLRVIDQSKPSVTSPVYIQSVALKVGLRARHVRHRRHRVRFRGHVSPARVGNVVMIQKRRHRRWRTVAITLTRARTASYSGYKRRLRLRHGGRFRVVVKTSGGDYVDGTSRTVRVHVRR